MSLNNIIGHNNVVNNLLAKIRQNKSTYSMILYGPPGIGKRTIATEIIKTINCKNSNEDPCDRCNSCRWINENRHPDVIIITNGIRAESLGIKPLIKKDTTREEHSGDTTMSDTISKKDILIEQIRYLSEVIYTAPVEGRYRTIFIIDAETLNKSAANAFLKTLEEPPDRTIIIMTSSFLGMIPPTIRSRAEKVRLNPLKDEDMERLLKEKIGFSSEYKSLILRLLNGSLDKRILSLDDGSIKEYLEIAKRFVENRKMNFDDILEISQLISSGTGRYERDKRMYVFFTFLNALMLDIYLGRNENIWGISKHKIKTVNYEMIEDLKVITEQIITSQNLFCNTGITVKSQLLRYARLWNIL